MINDAPPLTKIKATTRDAEMKQDNKNARTGYFGIRAHVSTDTGALGYTQVNTHAAASEFDQLPKLLYGDKRAPDGCQPNWNELRRLAAR